MIQRYDVCREITNAKLLLMYESEGKKKCYNVIPLMMLFIMAGGNHAVTQELLLKAAKFESITLERILLRGLI